MFSLRGDIFYGCLKALGLTRLLLDARACVAGDSNGDILAATDRTGGASAWTSATVDIPSCPRQSAPCISERLYARDDRGARTVDAAPPGSGNSIGSVALEGNSLLLSWTHDGDRRQLRLR